jgi:L-rhamnose-H+ transport protein
MFGSLLLLLLAGGMNGSFAVPMKYVRGWQWEHTWFLWSLLGMLFLPFAVAFSTIPNLALVYHAAGLHAVMRTVIYGMLWGIGAILFGLGITRVGLAVGFGIILGTSSLFGTVVPLVLRHHDQLFTTRGVVTLTGLCIVLMGVAACALAGRLREAGMQQSSRRGSFTVGLVICLLSGIGSASMSLALNESTPILRAAESFGVPQAISMNATWPVLLSGGVIVNAAFCAYLVLRNGTIALFAKRLGLNAGLAATMAVLWSGSNYVYAAGARAMGSLGLILGWPIFMAAIVLTANGWGSLTGEWRGAARTALRWAATGCALLILGIWIIAWSGSSA